MAAGHLWRSSVSKNAPFRRDLDLCRVRDRSHRHGGALRILQQHSVDRHGLVRCRPRGLWPVTAVGRRRFLASATTGFAGIALAGCDRLTSSPTFREFLGSAEGMTEVVQRALLWRGGLAREYSAADISRPFRANGSQDASNLPPAYQVLADAGFADWHLEISGRVEKPIRFSLRDLHQLPARTQITRHDCVEGWSCIGGWKGVQLATILDRVAL